MIKLKRCYIPNCTAKAKVCCNCTSSRAYMCQAHIGNHAQSVKSRSHRFQLIEIIDEEIENFAFNLLYEEKSKISQLKKESVDIFNKLFLSLGKQLRNLCQLLDMNLSLVEQKITKIKETEDISIFEKDQLLGYLLSKDTANIEKMCLVDERIIANIRSLMVL